MNRRKVVQALFIVLCVLAAVPVAAATAPPNDAPACNPAPTATPASADNPQQPVDESIGGVGAASTCTAHCYDGSTVTCGESSSCYAQDQQCWGMGQTGYCEDSSGKTYCQSSCPTGCNAAILCGAGPGGGFLDCSGDYYCNQAEGCWVVCDSTTLWCPGASTYDCPYPN